VRRRPPRRTHIVAALLDWRPLLAPEGCLTKRTQQFARVGIARVGIARVGIARFAAILLAGTAAGKTGVAWGQAAVRDQSGTLTATAGDSQKKSFFAEKFAGSFVDLSTYVGSGSFYTSGYRDPYVSNALYVRPTYQLGTKYKLALNARVYLEEEYTKPDTSNGRRFYPLDSWLFLTAKNLYTMPRAKVKFSGSFRTVVPTSYESRYAHLVTTLSLGLTASRLFEFGRPDAQGKQWNLSLTLGSGFGKALRTSPLRGHFPGDTSGCREGGSAGLTGMGGGPSDSDRCGGPLSTSYGVSTSGGVSLSRSKVSASVTLIVINDFKYTVSPDTWTQYLKVDTANTIPQGRSDATWGVVSLGYDYSDHLSIGLGVASYQPALDSRYQHLRFPFFDFSGANAHNFTQAFVSVTGTL
jgi:hypothetical protein